MSVQSADHTWGHLLPEFATSLRHVLTVTAARTGRPWVLVEGYRSPERQCYLYGQGRPQLGSGPPWFGRGGKPVTWLKTPRKHGAGVAADVYPQKKILGVSMPRPDFSAPRVMFDFLRAAWQKEGLGNSAWGEGDLGHIEVLDPAMIRRGRAFVAAGFQAPGRVALVTGERPLSFYLNGTLLSDVGCSFLPQAGRVLLQLRPLAAHMEWSILRFWTDGSESHVLLCWDDDNPETPVATTTESVPVRLIQDASWVAWIHLARLFPTLTARLEAEHNVFSIATP